jgi:hypothetical protein
MSEDTWSTPPQQPEGIAWGKVLGAAGVTLAVFAAAVVLQCGAGLAGQHARAPGGARPPLREPEIGMVEQTPFPLHVRGYQRRADQLDRLAHWGWSDRSRNLVHEPIDRAMAELVAEDARARGRAP